MYTIRAAKRARLVAEIFLIIYLDIGWELYLNVPGPIFMRETHIRKLRQQCDVVVYANREGLGSTCHDILTEMKQLDMDSMRDIILFIQNSETVTTAEKTTKV